MKIRVVINPAAGGNHPILSQLNAAFTAHDVDWDVSITKPQSVREALERALEVPLDLLLVCGGDGTVARVAGLLLERQTAPLMGVLPCGTANALAEFLRTDVPLEDALERFALGRYRAITSDVGKIGDAVFLSRVSIGVAAGMTGHVSREEKERLGLLAYALSSLRATRDVETETYLITLDDHEPRRFEAIGCIVANSPGTGIGVELSSELDFRDSLLDVYVIESLARATNVLSNVVTGGGLMDGLTHLQAQRVRIETATPARIHADGESIGATPCEISIAPGALRLAAFDEPHS